MPTSTSHTRRDRSQETNNTRRTPPTPCRPPRRGRLMSIAAALLLGVLTLTAAQRSLPLLTVDPGSITRAETIVNFALPPTINGDSLQLRAIDGDTVTPLQ